MKKNTFNGIMMAVFVMLYVGVLYAENFQGEIKSVDLPNNTVTVLKTDPNTGKTSTDEIVVATSGITELKNFESLGDLRAGDELQFNGVLNNATGKWDAESLSVAKVQLEAGEQS